MAGKSTSSKPAGNTTGDKIDRRKLPRGPRTQYFVVMGTNKAGEIVDAQIAASNKEEAEKQFKTDTKLVPLKIRGPFYDVKGTGSSQPNRLTVDLPFEEIRYGTQRWQAVLGGYTVIATGLGPSKDFKANELVWVVLGAPVDPQNKGPKPRLSDRPVVRFSALENPTAI